MLFFSLSCRKNSVIREVIIDESLFKTIQIDPSENQSKTTKISEIADNISFIPLFTSNEVLIGEITKMIIWNDRYYIWDRMTETIFCFDSEGQFVNKLNKRGQGPGEFPRIRDFTIDKTNGNICIYSDVGQGIYEYTNDGFFIKKISIRLLFNSFAVLNEDTLFFYCGKINNSDFFRSSYPNQYRYLVMSNNSIINQQLAYAYKGSHQKLPTSRDNFTYYKDLLLLNEHLTGEIYSIDSVNHLIPRYRIEFLTNTYHFSFEKDIDLKQMNNAEESGKLAKLFGGFYETDNYLFINYSRILIGLAYVNKNNNTIHNLGYSIYDDFNEIGLPSTLISVDENYIYMKVEPYIFVQDKKLNGDEISSDLKTLLSKIDETSNPVLVKLKLKQP